MGEHISDLVSEGLGLTNLPGTRISQEDPLKYIKSERRLLDFGLLKDHLTNPECSR